MNDTIKQEGVECEVLLITEWLKPYIYNSKIVPALTLALNNSGTEPTDFGFTFDPAVTEVPDVADYSVIYFDSEGEWKQWETLCIVGTKDAIDHVSFKHVVRI